MGINSLKKCTRKCVVSKVSKLPAFAPLAIPDHPPDTVDPDEAGAAGVADQTLEAGVRVQEQA